MIEENKGEKRRGGRGSKEEKRGGEICGKKEVN
jgi:hypothetical protein